MNLPKEPVVCALSLTLVPSNFVEVSEDIRGVCVPPEPWLRRVSPLRRDELWVPQVPPRADRCLFLPAGNSELAFLENDLLRLRVGLGGLTRQAARKVTSKICRKKQASGSPPQS